MESYNSKYPIEYYDKGTAYKFYGSNMGEYADRKDIKKYANFFDLLLADGQDITNEYSSKEIDTKATRKFRKKRFIGVVVDKMYDPSPRIKVMFANNNEGDIEFRTKYYAANNTKGCTLDGKEIIPAEVCTDYNTGIESRKSSERTSGIKRIYNKNKTSGITKVNKINTDVMKGVSGIKAVKNNNASHTVSGIKAVKDNDSSKSVSGIKLVKETVSGIKLVKK